MNCKSRLLWGMIVNPLFLTLLPAGNEVTGLSLSGPGHFVPGWFAVGRERHGLSWLRARLRGHFSHARSKWLLLSLVRGGLSRNQLLRASDKFGDRHHAFVAAFAMAHAHVAGLGLPAT